MGECAINNVRIDVSPAIHPKDPTSGTTCQQGKVGTGNAAYVLNTIEASSHMRKHKSADQTMCDTLALESGQCGIFWCGLAAIHDFESSQAQAAWLVAEDPLPAYESLFEEQAGCCRAAIGNE